MAPRIILMLIVLVFPLGSPNTQKSGECERTLSDCQANVKQLNDQLRTRDKSCGSLKQELNDARLESQKWKEAYQQVKDDCVRQIAAARRDCEGLNNQVADLTKKLADLSKALNDSKGQAAAAQRESERLKQENSKNLVEISDLKKQLDALHRVPAELEKQLNAAKQQVEKYRSDYEQLSAQNTDLKTRYSNLDSEFSNLKKQMLELTRSRDSLQQQLGVASQDLNGLRSENARLSATNSNLDRQVAEFERGVWGASLPYNPQALLISSKTTDDSVENRDRADLSCEKDGKIHGITELVIGTLETIYDPIVRPGTNFPVEAKFTPHPILKGKQPATDPITWHLELQYHSNRIKDVRYDTEMSGRKAQRREIKLDGSPETWGWEVTAPKDFQKDRSEIIVYAGYSLSSEEPTLTDITREPVALTEKETPGAFALALAFIKDNLSYILGVISVLVAIWATLISIKKSKLEVRLKEMELEPRS
ncbi:MAG: hypothetical protein AABN34_03660 [Acidobacteriota bacterium]